jgi:hypothetical protein
MAGSEWILGCDVQGRLAPQPCMRLSLDTSVASQSRRVRNSGVLSVIMRAQRDKRPLENYRT